MLAQKHLLRKDLLLVATVSISLYPLNIEVWHALVAEVVDEPMLPPPTSSLNPYIYSPMVSSFDSPKVNDHIILNDNYIVL